MDKAKVSTNWSYFLDEKTVIAEMLCANLFSFYSQKERHSVSETQSSFFPLEWVMKGTLEVLKISCFHLSTFLSLALCSTVSYLFALIVPLITIFEIAFSHSVSFLFLSVSDCLPPPFLLPFCVCVCVCVTLFLYLLLALSLSMSPFPALSPNKNFSKEAQNIS